MAIMSWDLIPQNMAICLLENFIFTSSTKSHIYDVINSQLGHELPASVKDRVISSFFKGFISRNFASVKLCDNEILTKISVCSQIKTNRTNSKWLSAKFVHVEGIYNKFCLKQPLRNRQDKTLKDKCCLKQVKSIAECSHGAFCNTFDLH